MSATGEMSEKDYREGLELNVTNLEASVRTYIKEIAELEADVAALSKTNRELIRDATHGIDKAQAIRDMVEECFVGDLYELRTSILYYADKLEQK